jgi:Saxitoxin biosynthesis operon protein SxtJ
MAAGIPTRLSAAAAGRRFGRTVGLAFVVLGGIAWWRGHPTTASVFGALGLSLLLAGLVIPAYLGPVERGWMALAHAISRVTTPIMMGVMYFVVLTPIGILRRTLGANPLHHVERNDTFWKPRPPNARRSASMERQF